MDDLEILTMIMYNVKRSDLNFNQQINKVMTDILLIVICMKDSNDAFIDHTNLISEFHLIYSRDDDKCQN